MSTRPLNADSRGIVTVASRQLCSIYLCRECILGAVDAGRVILKQKEERRTVHPTILLLGAILYLCGGRLLRSSKASPTSRHTGWKHQFGWTERNRWV